jgi:integration host factor subunit beta
MIKSQLILRVAAQNPHLSNSAVEKVVNSIFDKIATALVRGDRVELRRFGSFTVRTWKPRPLGRNPKTGAPLSIRATRHASFRTGAEMRDRLNATLESEPRAALDTP